MKSSDKLHKSIRASITLEREMKQPFFVMFLT